MLHTDPSQLATGNGGGGALVSGFEAGLLGGVAMAACMAASAVLAGMDPLTPLAPMGDAFVGPLPREPGAARLAYGFALHLIFSGFIGALFTAVFPRDFPPKNALVVGIGLSWTVMALMTSIVLPAYNPSLRSEMSELGGSWVLAHAAYGVTVGFFGQWLRQRRRVRAPATVRTRAA